MTPPNRARLIKSLGAAVGFDRVGIARAGPSERAAYYKAWLAAGHAGSMENLKRNVGIRADPSQLLSGTRSIISVAVSYHRPAESASEDPRDRPERTATEAYGRVASYALGRDYHVVVRQMLADLLSRLHLELREPFDARICVDTAPTLERDVAAQAGVGWIGKNTCLIDRRLGSYLFLGEMLTTLDVEPDAPVSSHCGACTRCLKACPTGALIAPHQLDASRCISYLTIEHRGEIPAEFHSAMGNWVYGCDICQQVCPYNKKAPATTHPEFLSEHTPAMPNLLELIRMRSGDYRRLTRDGPGRRAARNMWRRNAAIALGNLAPTASDNIVGVAARATRDEITAALDAAACDDDAAVRSAAASSLGRQRARGEHWSERQGCKSHGDGAFASDNGGVF